jgi:hypothetical protein
MDKISFYGNGFYSDKAIITLIPKNVSTAISSFCAWNKCDYTAVNRRNYIVVLRDPVDRWISGATEYVWRSTHIHGAKLEDIDLSQIELDRHTKPQYEFIKMLDLKRTMFYKFDSTVLHRLQADWNCFRKTAKLDIVNQIADSADKTAVRAYVRSHLPQLESQILSYYADDFQLTNSVKML